MRRLETQPPRRLGSIVRPMLVAARVPNTVRYAVSVLDRIANGWRELEAAWSEMALKIAGRIADAQRERRRRTLKRLTRTKEPAILFLVPEAGLLPFYASHVILARTVMDEGRAAIVLSCNGLLPICSWKFARGMTPTTPGDKANPACESCIAQTRITGRDYGLVDVPIDSVVDEAEKTKIAQIMADNASAPWDMVWDGIAFGSIAKGEVLRHRRLLEISDFTPSDHKLLEAILYSALAVYFAIKKLADRYAIERLAYFGDYAYWLASVAYARRIGIHAMRIDHAYYRDFDRRLIGLRPESANVHIFDHQIGSWSKYCDRSIEPEAIEKIAGSALFRLGAHGGVSTYSPNWILRDTPVQDELGLSHERPTLVAFPSSSDEVVALRNILSVFGKSYGAGKQPFEDQVDWLTRLSEWVGMRSELQLIIRLHPRIGSNHRHTSSATEFAYFRDAFATLPPNVRVVWPQDKISSYNLAEIADLALVSWSSIGLELARFGVPVVASFTGYGAYPTGGFAKFAADATAYFQLIERMTGRLANMADITDAFRWTYYLDMSPLVDVSDVVPSPDYGQVPPWRKPNNHRTIARVLIGGEDLSEIAMDGLAQDTEARQREHEALLTTMQRFLRFFAASDTAGDFCTENIRGEEGGVIAFKRGGRMVRRYSPLSVRLCALLDEFARSGALSSADAKR